MARAQQERYSGIPSGSTVNFDELGLIEPLIRAVGALGYTEATPIQTMAIPPLLEGRDLLGTARTGTGKTAAFALPLLQRLSEHPRPRRPGRPRALVLTPTRELAIQIDRSFRDYGAHLSVSMAVLFGGVGQAPQVTAMQRAPDVLTATPGRLLDLIGQGHIALDALEVFVLDEADRMLDMGFLPDVRKVLALLPARRQTLFFSATMPPDIAALSDAILTDPVRVSADPESTPAERVTHRVMFVSREDKRQLLVDVVSDPRVVRTLVFTRTKHRADRVAKYLAKQGVAAAAIHGDKSQGARQRALEAFRAGELPVLVATDLAARGIDIDGITHVVNYELPDVPETYVHRIGRTARAGSAGLAISFCDTEELPQLREIEQLIGARIQVAGDRIGLSPEELSPPPVGGARRSAAAAAPAAAGAPGRKRGRRRRRR